MIQVIKRTKVGSQVHEHIMSFSEPEWALIQQHYKTGNVTFEKVVKEVKEIDDKPPIADYEVNRNLGSKHYKDGDFSKALYYFELALKDKESYWLTGRINRCKKEINENSSNR